MRSKLSASIFSLRILKNNIMEWWENKRKTKNNKNGLKLCICTLKHSLPAADEN